MYEREVQLRDGCDRDGQIDGGAEILLLFRIEQASGDISSSRRSASCIA